MAFALGCTLRNSDFCWLVENRAFPTLHINPGGIIFEDEKCHVCNGLQRLPPNRFWFHERHCSVAVSWRLLQGCSSTVNVGHWAGHGRSGERVRAATLIWRAALIIQQLWWEIIAQGFSTSRHCPRSCCASAALQEFCAPRLSLAGMEPAIPGFHREVRPLPWAVMIS